MWIIIKEKIASKYHDSFLLKVKKCLEISLAQRNGDKPLVIGKKVQENMVIGGTTYHIWFVKNQGDLIGIIEIKK